MRFSIFDQWSARNSGPVWHAFCRGAERLGHQIVNHDQKADVAVIWSQVWAGRMRNNHRVWQHFRENNRPVLVLEVGTLRRGSTWKLGLNGLNGVAYWGQGQDPARPQRLGITLKPWRDRGQAIVILMQRSDSEQWADMPTAQVWLDQTVAQLRSKTDRGIVIRPHPRQKIHIPTGCGVHNPQQLINTYDDYDLASSLADAWAVVNANSGAGVSAILQGVPLFCTASSLAAPVANLSIDTINDPLRPSRESWLIDLCHTEWTTAELESGWPLERMISVL